MLKVALDDRWKSFLLKDFRVAGCLNRDIKKNTGIKIANVCLGQWLHFI